MDLKQYLYLAHKCAKYTFLITKVKNYVVGFHDCISMFKPCYCGSFLLNTICLDSDIAICDISLSRGFTEYIGFGCHYGQFLPCQTLVYR